MGVLKGSNFLDAHQLLVSRKWRLARSTRNGQIVFNFYKKGTANVVLFINTADMKVAATMEA